jgi:hypothetical protein
MHVIEKREHVQHERINEKLKKIYWKTEGKEQMV